MKRVLDFVDRLPVSFIGGLYMITAISGLLDVACFLALGGVFAELMTGNILLLAIQLGSGHPDWATIAGLAGALVPFIIGAFLGGRLLRGPKRLQERRIGFVVEWCALVGAAAISIAAGTGPDNPSRFWIVGMLAFAMGLQDAMIRHHGHKDLATSLLTFTLTGLMADKHRAGKHGEPRWPIQFSSIAVFFFSAMIGALLIIISPVLPLVLAAAIFTAALVPLTRKPAVRPA